MSTHVDQGFSTNQNCQLKELINQKAAGKKCPALHIAAYRFWGLSSATKKTTNALFHIVGSCPLVGFAWLSRLPRRALSCSTFSAVFCARGRYRCGRWHRLHDINVYRLRSETRRYLWRNRMPSSCSLITTLVLVSTHNIAQLSLVLMFQTFAHIDENKELKSGNAEPYAR